MPKEQKTPSSASIILHENVRQAHELLSVTSQSFALLCVLDEALLVKSRKAVSESRTLLREIRDDGF